MESFRQHVHNLEHNCRVYTVGDDEMTVTSALIEGYTHSKIELKQKEKRYQKPMRSSAYAE